jgi:hypothetical protein
VITNTSFQEKHIKLGKGKNVKNKKIPVHDKKTQFVCGNKLGWTIHVGAATICATQHIINASYNQHHRFFHLSPEPQML